MRQRMTAVALAGLESLYRNAIAARDELAACVYQDAAVDEACLLLDDIADAAYWVRVTPTTLTQTEQRRRVANSKSGG
jgi:hypothetical protein